jgi:hypothetical protein
MSWVHQELLFADGGFQGFGWGDKWKLTFYFFIVMFFCLGEIL